MQYTLEQKQKAYKNLPDAVKDFVMSNESSDIVEKNLILAGFNDEQIDESDSEIFHAMIGLQSFEDSMMNIAQITGRSPRDLSQLRENLQNEIFEAIKYLNKPDKQTLDKTVGEIAEKYTLDSEQKEELVKIVEDVYTEPQNRELILNGLENRLNVSKILSEQIIIELGDRVFNAKLTTKSDNYDVARKVESLPKVQETQVRQPEVSQFAQMSKNPVLDSQKSNEIATPRYADGVINTQKSSNSIIEKKLNSVTSSNSTPIKYEKDPYREPLN